MKLKAIELKGFKSFADRTRIEFLEGVTCIVGPNGCGKSNITDAIRWVLGEQSSGSLRATKMEDVIFNGTSHRAPLHFAEVSLIFDDAQELLETGERELSIKRLLHRSGESSYYLNGSLVRLKDVKELLMDTGIGVSGYSLISQGDIEDILKDSKFNRRKIFEEASGISLFDFKKREAERKLFRVEENLTRIRDIFQEIDQRIHPLEEASTKAKRYLELKDAYKKVHIHFFLTDYETHHRSLQELEVELQELKRSLSEKEDREEHLREKRSELQGKSHALKEEESLLEDLYREKSRDREDILIDVKLTEQRLEQKRDEVPVLDDAIKTAESNIVMLHKEMEELEILLRREEAVKEEEEASLKAMTEKLHLLREQLEETQSRSTDLYKKRHELEVGLSKAKETLHFLQEEIEKDEEKSSAIKSERKEERLKRRTLEDQSLELEEALDEASSKLSGLSVEKEQLQASLGKFKEQSQTIDDLIHQKELEKRKLETELAMIESFSKEAKEKNEENESLLKRHLKGKTLGTLLDKLSPKKGYEEALSTLLDNYVSTLIVKGSKEEVTSLKKDLKHDLRLVFTEEGLEDVSLSEDHTPITDILTYKHEDEAWIKALFSGVAFSEKAPERGISYKVVTKDGVIYYPDGSLQLGSKDASHQGMFHRSESFEKLRELEEEVYALKEEELEVREKLEMEEESLKGNDAQHLEKREDIQRIRGLLSDVKEELGMIYFKEKQLKGTAEHLEHSIQDKQQRIERALLSIKEKSEMLNTLLESDTKKDPGELRARYNEALEEQTQKRIELTKLEESYSHNMRTLRSSSTRKVELEDQLLNSKKRKVELQELLDELQATLDTSREKQGVIQQELSSLSSQMKLLKESRQEVEATLESIETEREALQHKLLELRSESQRLEINEVRLQEKIQTITTELWNQYELSIFAAKQEVDPEASFQRKELKNLSVEMLSLEPVNLGAIHEYEEVKERHSFLKEQMDDLESSKKDIEKSIRTLEKTMLESFKKTFEDIKGHFNQVFSELFQGGSGDIRLVDEENILESDINILASPPGKKLTHMSLLSGGEKALTAIALLFSVLRAKPAPFYVLDEIEAALDDFNISRFGSFLEEFSKGSQFIIITHRKGTMQFAKALYGVSMEEKGVSNVISLQIKENEHV